MHVGSHHKCQICNKEVTSQLLLTDVAYYSNQTGNLIMVARLACKGCREEISTVRKFVEDQGLSFSKNSAIYQEYVDGYLRDCTPLTHPHSALDSDIYDKNIQQQIKRNKLYHCAKLPMNCLQLVYYSSITINHAERHERIRNTIGQCMKVVPIPYANLEDVSILVHCLSCFMHQTQVVLLLKLICQRVIVEGSPMADQQSDGDLPMERLWKELYSSYYIGNILVVIAELLRNWKNFQSSLEKLRAYHGYIKKDQVKELLSHNFNSPTTKKNLSHSIDVNASNLLPNNILSNCKDCNRNRIQHLLNQARMKNIFTLILKILMKQDVAHREHTLQLEAKFLREKEEFINKIIKLKDRIEILEHEEEGEDKGMLRRARSVSEYHIKKHTKPDLEVVSEKSQATNKTIEIKQKNDQNLQANESEKAKSNEGILAGYLQRFVTALPEFDPALLASDVDHNILAETIENSLKKMREQIEKLDKKNKILENQSKRLLTILTRKQQRFVPLIHQKDEIIEKYENALWKMQHGLIVQDPVLAPRIANIINVFKNDFMQSLSNGTLESDIYNQQILQSPPPPQKQKVEATPNKTSKKKKEKVKSSSEQKVKEGGKECTIF